MALSHPLTKRIAHPPPGFGLPPLQPRFHPGGRGTGEGAGATRTANRRAERGPGGGLCGRPARGESSANGRAPHIPGSGAPQPGRSGSGGSRPGLRPGCWSLGRGAHWKGGEDAARPAGRQWAAIVACSLTVYVRPGAPLTGLARVGESGAVLSSAGTSAGCPIGSKPSVRLVQPRGIMSQILPLDTSSKIISYRTYLWPNQKNPMKTEIRFWLSYGFWW